MVVISNFIPMSYLKLLFLACFLCSSLCAKSLPDHSCATNDLLALREFAGNLTNGTIIKSWSDESVCCQWNGVVCENNGNGSVSSRVMRLILPKQNLNGTVSAALGRLDQLKLLDLSFNHLQGRLPVGLSNLKQLEVLDLSYNMFTGQVSESLSGLKAIHTLNISSNLFGGDFSQLGMFPNLAVFNVSNNSFSGRINPEICSSTIGISVLDVSMNHLEGNLEGLKNCSASLQQLRTDSNSFTGHLPEFLYSISGLEQLSISGNYFSGKLSEKLSNLSRLKSLILSDNQFSGELPNVFANLRELEQFIAHSNSFSGQLPLTLELCSKLRTLDIRNNSLVGRIDLNFSRLPDLCVLDLASNRLTGNLPNSLSDCPDLRILSLAKNDLTGRIPDSFANLSSLLFFSISNNSLVDLQGALSVLQQCKNLTTLILTKNFKGEVMPINVAGFESLKILGLGNCGLQGRIPDWLSKCRKLQVLDLSWNFLDGTIPPWIGQMENLFYLDFSNNSFTGEIPASLMELKSLVSTNYSSCAAASTGIPLYIKQNKSASGRQYNQLSSFPPSIYLSSNKISGTIAPEIGRLKQLHVLDLSKNNISGIIPSSIAEMGNLEILDLSNNNLYGSIPKSFEKLTFLSKFSVAHNYLTGDVPRGGQFTSFPQSSFEENPGLCIDSPCELNNSKVQPSIRPHRKFSQGTIVGIIIGIGAGFALLLTVILLRFSRPRDVRDRVNDLDEEYNRVYKSSEGCGSSKLVLFHDSECDLTVADLLKSTNNFNQANIIGCGGFGLVYKANLPDGSKVAVKRLSGDCGQMEREFQAEVEALSRAQHPNLVSLQGYCKHGNDRLLIYSYMENGSLDYWLHECFEENTRLKWNVRLKIAQGAAHGLAYLHKDCEPNIVHRDVKSSNILLDSQFEAHLADFGLSRLLRPYDTHITTDLVGTLGYIPPEYSQTLTATCRGDVYSLGVVLLELVTGRRPVEVCKGKKNCRDLVSWVLQMQYEKREAEVMDTSIWAKDSEKQVLEMFEIACKCINGDPKKRPLSEEVVLWLDGIGTECSV